MGLKAPRFQALFIAASFVLPVIAAGCGPHVYRVYDPYYTDYHVWDGHERGYYNQWIIETNHPHRDYRRLSADEQRQYWTWRHTHGEPGHPPPPR
jgi:hypothetical protein